MEYERSQQDKTWHFIKSTACIATLLAKFIVKTIVLQAKFVSIAIALLDFVYVCLEKSNSVRCEMSVLTRCPSCRARTHLYPVYTATDHF